MRDADLLAQRLGGTNQHEAARRASFEGGYGREPLERICEPSIIANLAGDGQTLPRALAGLGGMCRFEGDLAKLSLNLGDLQQIAASQHFAVRWDENAELYGRAALGLEIAPTARL